MTTRSNRLNVFCAAACAVLLYGLPAAAQDAATLRQAYPAGSIHSVEAADQAIAEVGRERAAVEARFDSEERACFERFFANACIDNAKERRRAALEQLRPIEIEAKAFKRHERAAERDRIVAEKRAKAEIEDAQRAEQLQQNEAERARREEVRARNMAPVEAPPVKDDREQRHQAKLRRIEEKERADADKRAANVAAYERKVKEAEERERKLQEKKLEKEQQRAAKGSLLD